MTRRLELAEAVDELALRLHATDLRGWDPYDALASPYLRRLGRGPLARRALIQALKRSPVNLRAVLGVPRLRHTKALALVAFARALLGDGNGARELADELVRRSIRPAPDQVGWGYDFDVQTRWGYYPRDQPNAVVTSFVLRALVAAGGPADVVAEGVRFCIESLAVDRPAGPFFTYYRGSQALIHNANAIVADAILRAVDGGSEAAALARAALDSTLRLQRPDGSWPYGEGPGLGWIDGFHTAYVLEALAAAGHERAVARGLEFFLEHLVDRDGAPRATVAKRYPLDIHAAASGVAMLARLHDRDPRALETAGAMLAWTNRELRRPEGGYGFQRHAHWTNRIEYVRWANAHMLVALVELLQVA